MIRRDGMEVYSGDDVDLSFPSLARATYKYVTGVRKRLLGRVFSKDIAIKTEDEIHHAFYYAGNRRVNGVGVDRVLDSSMIKLPLSEKKELCFKRVDLSTNPRKYFVYVEKIDDSE